MPKSRSHYICNQCGTESSQYFGKCPACNNWNTLEEQVSLPPAPVAARGGAGALRFQSRHHSGFSGEPHAQESLTFDQISEHPQSRLPSGFIELDRVLGGGIVPGSLVLIGGDPGIGKSTLLLQMANQLARRYRTLYVCAEESAQQVKLRAQRLGVGQAENQRSASGDQRQSATQDTGRQPGNEGASPYVLPEIDLDRILAELDALQPHVAVIDSIQALYFSALTSAPGSVAQVRECTSILMQLAKRQTITLFIVGHVTKEGAIAGPKVLEHLVDTVLYFEGDRFASHRLLRSVKNRFGATHEIGVFEMADRGLMEVLNPSELFLGNRDEQAPGSATIVACEGTRPIMVEIQALVSATSYSSPRRTTTGVEYNRLLQILAVLEKRVGIPLSKLDAYVASAGGLSVAEPAADLGVAVAIVASFRDRVIDPYTILIGEVSLSGQVRPVSQLELRLKEAAKLGFKRAIVPKGQTLPNLGLQVVAVNRLIDAIVAALPGPAPIPIESN